MRIRSANPRHTHAPIGRYISVKHNEEAQQVIAIIEVKRNEPLDHNLANIKEYFKIYCKLAGFKRSDLKGDINRNRLYSHYRKIFVGVMAMIYDPNLFSGSIGSKAKLHLRSTIAEVLDMNPNKVSDYFSEAIEQSFFPDLSVIWQEMESFKIKVLKKKNKIPKIKGEKNLQ